jgi:septum site-determining protein MinC
VDKTKCYRCDKKSKEYDRALGSIMKAKQKKIRVFDIEIESEDKFFEFMDKNFILVKDYLLLVSGDVTAKVREYLDSNSLCYVLSDGCSIKKIDSKEQKSEPVSQEKQTTSVSPQVIVQEKVVYQDSQSVGTKVIQKPVRSGEVIEHDGDVVLFSRINSGAKIVAEGNVTVFDVIDGVVEANGDFAILKSIGKGYVVFNGDILERDDFNGTLKKVIATSEGYKIEDIG